jgi:hypothetical protein
LEQTQIAGLYAGNAKRETARPTAERSDSSGFSGDVPILSQSA